MSTAVPAEDDRYRTLLDSIDEGYCVVELLFDDDQRPVDYCFLEVNASFEAQSGLRDAVGRTMRELAPAHEQHWFDTYGRVAVTGEPVRFQNRAEQLGRTFDVYAFRLGAPQDRQVAILFRDVTEELRVRGDLERFFSLSLDLLCISSADGYFKRVSPAVTDTLGWTTNEFLATPFIDLVHPDDREATLREVERQVVAGEKVLHFENRYRHKDGSWRVLAWRSVPSGDLMYATARDVTELRQMERRAIERSAQLEAANAELEAFSYSVSHDLRAPLRHIHGYAGMLRVEMEDRLSDKARRFLDTIGQAANSMGRLIDDLLSFSRTGRMEMHEGTVDLGAVVRRARQDLELALRERDVTWTVADLPKVRGDEALLGQVMANLLGNAVKYTRQRSRAQIEVGCAGTEGDRVVFYVRDNGAGFEMEYADRLFGVFQRLHRADEFEGTGIGLAIVRRIVARHGGRTWAEGAVDQGATFYFALPGANPKAGVS